MTQRHKGTRWSLLFGSYAGTEQFAVEEAQRFIQSYLPYVLRVEVARQPGTSSTAENLAGNLVVVGTRDNNPLVAQLIDRGVVAAPEGAEGYALACADSPWSPGAKIVAVAGSDQNGVLYSVERLGLTLLPELAAPFNSALSRESLDNLPYFTLAERPKIASRGLWTWGYVIYDYRRFIDNMARLRLNMLTIWNDVPPINCRDVIACAHSRGVKVILGFAWGWGRNDLDLSKKEDREKISRDVVANFERDYAGLGMDGIYFQTLTEHFDKEKGNVSVAALAKELVNETAGELLAKHPGLAIQFGLHATSIGDRYADLADLDPRITIVWEDAGDIPFSYSLAAQPEACYAVKKPEAWVNSPETTLEYSRRLSALRGGTDEFAIVPKGWTCLDWSAEFEHHASFILGERDAATIRERIETRRRRWQQVNALWLKHHKTALHYYREMVKHHRGPLTVCGLIEDGLFEAEIQPSVALYAGTIWNPDRAGEEIVQEACILASSANRIS